MFSTEAGAGPVAGPGTDAWFTPWRFAALLGLLIIACFPNVISGLETFFYRDYAVFGYPLAVYHKEAFWRGEMPLWNPYNDCGLPFTAQWNTLTLYPLSLIYLLLPLPWSLNVFCLGHLFLAGMGAYFLGWRWTGNRLAAAVAGIGFAFNGLTWHALMWPNDIAAFGWMPWVLLAMDRAWSDGGRRVVTAGLVGAMQMLCGAPEVILFTWFVVGAFWVADFFGSEANRLRLIFRAAVSGVLVAALALVQLLPFLDLLAHSHRDNSFSDAQWAMPSSGWGNYLVPLLHTVRATHGVYVQHDQYWTSSYFAGVGVLLLALMAVWRVRHRRVWVLGALVVISVLMALGNNGPLYAVLRKVLPQLGFMRFPIKFVMVASLALPLLAAFGMARLRSVSTEQRPGEWRRLWGLGLILIAMIGGIIVVGGKFPQAGDDFQKTEWSGLRSVAFLAGAAALVWLLWRASEVKKSVIFQAALLVLLWMDVFTHEPTLSPTAPPGTFQAGLMRQYFTTNQYVQSDAELRPGGSRAMLTLASLTNMYWGGQEDPTADLLGRRAQLYDNLNLLDSIPKVDGFYSLYLREMNTVLNEVYTSTGDVSRAKDFMAVSLESEATHKMDWGKRPSCAPLITAGQRAVFLDDEQSLELLLSANFDGRKVVALPMEARPDVRATNETAVKITATNFAAERVSLHVEAAGPAMVVIAQAYYHAWHAYVDGKRTPLWRANYAFQAVEVPEGTHKVEIIYEDRGFRAGSVVSAITLLVCVWSWFPLRKRPSSEV